MKKNCSFSRGWNWSGGNACCPLGFKRQLQKSGVEFSFTEASVGGAALDLTGKPLPEETLKLCENSDAIFIWLSGGPKWNSSS